MIALVQEPPRIDGEDAFMTVVVTDHIDQDQCDTEIKCHYLASAPHLIRITPAIKKNSILYINGEFFLYNNESYVHAKSITFSGHLKSSISVDASSKIPWDDEISDGSSRTVSFAETIAAKFDIKHPKNKNSPLVTPPVTNLIAEPFAQANSDGEPSTVNQCATNSSSAAESHKRINSNKKSSVIKAPKTKPSPAKPYTQTRNRRKLTDLAKDMLNNPNASEQSPSVSPDHQNLT